MPPPPSPRLPPDALHILNLVVQAADVLGWCLVLRLRVPSSEILLRLEGNPQVVLDAGLPVRTPWFPPLVLSCLGSLSTQLTRVLAYTLPNAHVGHLKMSEDFA